MPFIVPFIPLIAAGIGAGTSIGLDLSNQPSSNSGKPTPAEVTQQSQNAVQQATQQRQGQADSAAQLLPDLQYNTGGGLSPDAYSSFSSTFSGNPGISNSSQLQQLVQNFLGTSNSTFGGTGGYGTASTGLTG